MHTAIANEILSECMHSVHSNVGLTYFLKLYPQVLSISDLQPHLKMLTKQLTKS